MPTEGAEEGGREAQVAAACCHVGQGGAEGSLGKNVLPSAARRGVVACLQARRGMSEVRAWRVIQADRESAHYRFTRDDDTKLREQLRELANVCCRRGYRRLYVMLSCGR